MTKWRKETKKGQHYSMRKAMYMYTHACTGTHIHYHSPATVKWSAVEVGSLSPHHWSIEPTYHG